MHLMHLAYAVNFDSTNHIDLNCSDRVYVHHLTPMAENRPVGVSLHNLRSKFTKLGHRSICNYAYLHMEISEPRMTQHWL